MTVTDFLRDIKRALRLATKPTMEEFKLTFKMVLLGMSILGVIGYFFQLAGATFQFATVQAIPRDVVLVAGIAIVVAVLGVVIYVRRKAAL